MKISDIDLNLLVFFEAIYHEQSITNAAKRVGIAQSSLSSALKRLRALFNDELFIRSGNAMRPTRKAEQLAPLIEDSLKNARRAITITRHFDPMQSDRTFVIGGSDLVAFTILPDLIHFLGQYGPNIKLEMTSILPQDVAYSIDKGIVDFAICPGFDHPEHLHMKTLFEEEMFIVIRRDHPQLAGRDEISIEEYAEMQHLIVKSKGHGEKIIDDELATRGLKRSVSLSLHNFLIVPYIVETSDIVATLTERVAYQCSQRSQIKLLSFPADLSRNTFNLLWGKASESSIECQWLMNNLQRLMIKSGQKA